MPGVGFFTFLRYQWLNLPYPETDHSGQTIIVTGANVGLGLEAARHFVRLNASRVILAVRSASKGEIAKRDIEATTHRTGVCEIWELDLTSPDSVRSFAKRAESELERLDVLLENAGIAGDNFWLAEGYDAQLTVNVLHTYLLAVLLLPLLRRSSPEDPALRRPHLVIVSSEVHQGSTFSDWSSPDILAAATKIAKDAGRSSNYSTSKLLEILLVRELAQRVPASEVIINAANPGFCVSELGRDASFMLRTMLGVMRMLWGRTSEMGCRNYMAASVLGEESHGGYVSNCVVKEPSDFVLSEKGVEAGKRAYEQVNSKLALSI